MMPLIHYVALTPGVAILKNLHMLQLSGAGEWSDL